MVALSWFDLVCDDPFAEGPFELYLIHEDALRWRDQPEAQALMEEFRSEGAPDITRPMSKAEAVAFLDRAVAVPFWNEFPGDVNIPWPLGCQAVAE